MNLPEGFKEAFTQQEITKKTMETKFKKGQLVDYRSETYLITDIETLRSGVYIYKVTPVTCNDPEELKTSIGPAGENDMTPHVPRETELIEAALLRYLQEAANLKDDAQILSATSVHASALTALMHKDAYRAFIAGTEKGKADTLRHCMPSWTPAAGAICAQRYRLMGNDGDGFLYDQKEQRKLRLSDLDALPTRDDSPADGREGRYGLVTWPESQDFIGMEGCILVDPPLNEKDPTALDSAYLVPENITGPLDSGEAYVRVPFPESQKWDDSHTDDPDDILHDYDSNAAYVRESVLISKTTRPEGDE